MITMTGSRAEAYVAYRDEISDTDAALAAVYRRQLELAPSGFDVSVVAALLHNTVKFQRAADEIVGVAIRDDQPVDYASLRAHLRIHRDVLSTVAAMESDAEDVLSEALLLLFCDQRSEIVRVDREMVGLSAYDEGDDDEARVLVPDDEPGWYSGDDSS
jgi:hypothetical protein